MPTARRALALPTLPALVAIASCGGGTTPSPSAAPSTSASAAPTASASPSASPSLATATAAPSVSPAPTAAGPPTCSVAQLAVAFRASQGAAGHIGTVLGFTNHGPTTCALTGYPGMLLLDAGGHALPTTVRRGGGMMFGTPPVGVVVLAPGGAAYAGVEYEDVPVGGETCPMPTQAEVTPPNDFDHAVVPFSGTVCSQGTLWATAVQATPPG